MHPNGQPKSGKCFFLLNANPILLRAHKVGAEVGEEGGVVSGEAMGLATLAAVYCGHSPFGPHRRNGHSSNSMQLPTGWPAACWFAGHKDLFNPLC